MCDWSMGSLEVAPDVGWSPSARFIVDFSLILHLTLRNALLECSIAFLVRTILAAAFAGRGPGLEVLPDLEVCLKPVVKGSDGIMEDCYGIAMKTISTNQTIKSCLLAPRTPLQTTL